MTDLESIKACLDSDNPVIWLFTGDSITHGGLHTHGWRSYPEHFAERVRWELGRYHDVIINTGISGNRVGDLLDNLEWRVLRFEPRVVSVMIGMNDATEGPSGREPFRADLDRLLGQIRDRSQAWLLVHTPNAITSLDPLRVDLPAYADVVRDVARGHGAALVDHHGCWVQRASPVGELLEDGAIHPNNLGHRLMAHTLFTALGIADEASATCRLYVP